MGGGMDNDNNTIAEPVQRYERTLNDLERLAKNFINNTAELVSIKNQIVSLSNREVNAINHVEISKEALVNALVKEGIQPKEVVLVQIDGLVNHLTYDERLDITITTPRMIKIS